ncbi:MAG: ADP-ribosylglycohydrolase family protein [Burkholderiales bacterium]
MLGAIIGDIVGSIYEFNNHRSKQFEFFGAGADFTDDTVCTIAVADALLNDLDPVEALRDWCTRYPNRGYGSMFRHWLSSGDPRPYGSFGNGAAMRVSPAALLATSLDDALAKARAVTVVTHNHPEGLKGAAATAHAIFLARSGEGPERIRDAIQSEYGYDLNRTVDGIRPNYYFNETCQETVPEALICALKATDFEDAIRNAISIGGDSDTVAAIAGGVAEALFGLPDAIRQEAESRLPAEMNALLKKLYADCTKSARPSL